MSELLLKLIANGHESDSDLMRQAANEIQRLEEKDATQRDALRKAHDKMCSWFSSEYLAHPDTVEVGRLLAGNDEFIIQYVRERASAIGRLREIAVERDSLRKENEKLIGLLKIAKCPNCDGSGSIPVPLGEHHVSHEMAIDAGDPSMEGQSMGVEWGQEQCQWCDERKTFLSEQEQPPTNTV